MIGSFINYQSSIINHPHTHRLPQHLHYNDPSPLPVNDKWWIKGEPDELLIVRPMSWGAALTSDGCSKQCLMKWNSQSYRLMMQSRRGTEKLSIGKLLEFKLRLIYRVVVVALFPINISDLSELKLLYSIKMGESQISVSQLDIWLISYDIDVVLLWLISNSKEIVLLTALIIY